MGEYQAWVGLAGEGAAAPGAAAFGGSSPAQQQLQQAVLNAQAALDENAKAIEDHTAAVNSGIENLRKLGVEAGTAAFRLLGFTGNVEDRYSIARGDIGAQAQGAVTARARSAFPLRAMSNQEIGALARGTAAQQVWQNYVAEQAQQEQSNAVREQLRAIIQFGPGNQRAAAGRALDQLGRREQAETTIGFANRAGDMANRASVEAQAQLSALSLRSEERRLTVAEQLAGFRRQSLQTEGQLAPVLLQQAIVQDRMVIAARDNLNSRRELIRAEQGALPSTMALSAVDYAQRRLELRAEVSRAAVRRGQAPTEDISQLRREYRGLELARPELELQSLDTRRAVEVVQQQRTGEQLAREATLTNLEEQARQLQDLQIPLEQNLRATQAKEASIGRTLELLDLNDTQERTSAQRRQNEAGQLRLVAEEITRQAEDYAAGLELGATAAERSQVALERARDALRQTIPLLNSLPTGDVAARVASGLAAGGAGPIRSASGLTIVFAIPPGDQARVRSEVNAAIDQFFSGFATGGLPAPGSAAGAGR
jgi:hypothetical protein